MFQCKVIRYSGKLYGDVAKCGNFFYRYYNVPFLKKKNQPSDFLLSHLYSKRCYSSECIPGIWCRRRNGKTWG